jgi:hypothetical protein
MMPTSAMQSSRAGPIGPLRTLLDRFRRSPSVPVPPAAGASHELTPVFAALDAVEAEAARRREDGETAASARRDSLQAELDEIAADARRRADAERARAFEELVAAARRQAQQELDGARREADRIRAAGSERTPELVRAVVECVRQGAS